MEPYAWHIKSLENQCWDNFQFHSLGVTTKKALLHCTLPFASVTVCVELILTGLQVNMGESYSLGALGPRPCRALSVAIELPTPA